MFCFTRWFSDEIEMQMFEELPWFRNSDIWGLPWLSNDTIIEEDVLVACMVKYRDVLGPNSGSVRSC